MTETEVNIPLLRKAVEWAEAEAAKPFELCGWYQADYMRAAVGDDGEPRPFFLSADLEDASRATKSAEINGCGTAFCIAGWVYAERYGVDAVDRDAEGIDSGASRLLGLTDGQANDLFEGANSIADVRRIAEDIAGERL